MCTVTADVARRWRWALLGLLYVALACTSCSSVPPPRNLEGAAIVSGSCPRDGAGLVPPFVEGAHPPAATPPNFAIARIVRCVVNPAVVEKSDGSIVHTVRQQEAGPTAALLAALALPDVARPGGNVQCAAMETPLVYLLLVNESGDAYRAHIPANWCDSPRPEVLDQIAQTRWRTTQTYKVVRTP